MPIKARTDMPPPEYGRLWAQIFGLIWQIESRSAYRNGVRDVAGTRSVYAERVRGIPDFAINREEIARYGLAVMDVGQIIESAIGGENIATTIEGRER
jgi:Cu(I)/Ag(I) efflux system membrane protein CusA/SilA